MKSIIAAIFLFVLLVQNFAFSQGLAFENEIRALLENDKIEPPPIGGIVFAGSSTFTLWTDIKDYFPGRTIINRGFGGSTLNDQILYAHSIIIPLKPVQVVIYCGENDFAYNENLTAEEVTERFIMLFNLIRKQLPETKITYVSMKPSPARWHLAGKKESANRLIRTFISSRPDASFVDIWDLMLNERQMPDSSLFLDDMLHMNKKGYRLWQAAIEKEIH